MVARRHDADPDDLGSGAGSFDPEGLVRFAELTRVPTRPLADVLAGALRSAGFTVRVLGDDGGGTIPPLGRLTGGIRVEVATDDLDDARELLEEFEQGAHAADLADGSTWAQGADAAASWKDGSGTDPDHRAGDARGPGGRPARPSATVGWLVVLVVAAVLVAAVLSR